MRIQQFPGLNPRALEGQAPACAGEEKNRFAPWLLLLCAVLTLGGVSLLVPHRAAQAAPPVHSAVKPAPSSAPILEGDGDGDELLEHWGDPKYAHEERIQLGGMAGGALLLGGALWAKRRRRPVAPAVALTLRDFSEDRKAA